MYVPSRDRRHVPRPEDCLEGPQSVWRDGGSSFRTGDRHPRSRQASRREHRRRHRGLAKESLAAQCVSFSGTNQCPVVPIRVLRPDPGLAADGRAVCDGGREECIHGVPTLGGERNMRRCGHGLPTADREVVQVLGPVGDAVVLRVEFLIAEWGEGGCIEPPARVQVCHDEEHVIDDDAANRHWFRLSTPGFGSLPSGRHALTARVFVNVAGADLAQRWATNTYSLLSSSSGCLSKSP
jgi:hypothetical protein